MTADLLLRAAFLALMGAASVSLWTLRVALTAEGRRAAASLSAGIEAVVFALVFASVLSSLDSPLEISGYAVGVAAGTFLGLLADGRLSTGQSALRVIVDGDGRRLAAALDQRGWPATRLHGEGLRGEAAMLLVVIDEIRVPCLLADLGQLAPTAFWTLERLHAAHPSVLPAGYVQVHGRHRTRRSRHDRHAALADPHRAHGAGGPGGVPAGRGAAGPSVTAVRAR